MKKSKKKLYKNGGTIDNFIDPITIQGLSTPRVAFGPGGEVSPSGTLYTTDKNLVQQYNDSLDIYNTGEMYEDWYFDTVGKLRDKERKTPLTRTVFDQVRQETKKKHGFDDKMDKYSAAAKREEARTGVHPSDVSTSGAINYFTVDGKDDALGYTTDPTYKPKQRVKYAPPEIVEKQKKLRDAGLYKGILDGVWGSKSQTAWEEYTNPQTEKEEVDISPDDNDYNTFVKTLPSNLRDTDTSTYNLRGYWEALGKPAKFDYSQPKEADGHYHAFSRNPQTGEILKKENHPTFRMAIEGDMQAGYTPYKNKATGKIHTFNEKPDMSKFEVYDIAPFEEEVKEKPKTTNFEQRILNPIKSIDNEDGTSSTHKMMSFEANGKHYAAPTIVEIDGELTELSPKEAVDYAMKNKEYKEFPSQETAQNWAEGGYKIGTPLEDTATQKNNEETKEEKPVSKGPYIKHVANAPGPVQYWHVDSAGNQTAIQPYNLKETRFKDLNVEEIDYKRKAQGGFIKDTDMQNTDFNRYVALMNAQRQQMKKGGIMDSWVGDVTAGAIGILDGGTALLGPLGGSASKGLDSLHSMLDSDIDDQEKAIGGWGKAAGAVTSAIINPAALPGAISKTAEGVGEGVAYGTSYGQRNDGMRQEKILGASNLIGNVGSFAAGNVNMGGQGGMGIEDMAQSFGGAESGIMTSAQQAGSTDVSGMGEMFNSTGQGTQIDLPTNTAWGAYGGMLPMAQGGFKPHPMYKGNEMVMANDYNTHLRLKEQGYGHQQNIRNMGQGGLTSIETGGTHEQNPMGGVPIGPKASVEQGETVMDLIEGGKFVFTDRDGPKGKKGKTFADISKKIQKKYEDREGDAAAKRAMDQELYALANQQEEKKEAKMAKLQAQMDELNPQGAVAQVPTMDPNMMQQPQMGGQPMHQMPDGTMMPGATHEETMNMGAYGYGGKLKKYGMGGPMMYPGGGMIPYGEGGRMQYGYGGSLNIPQEDIDYIEQMIDFELAHGSAGGTGLSYGVWSKNQASDRDSAIEFIYNKYVTPNKDLPIELRKRAADMHLNSEDPRASLMVAAGVIDPSQKGNIYRNRAEVTKLMEKDLGHKPTEKEYQANRSKYLGLQEDRLNAAWDKHKDKVIAKYNDPAFVEAFDKEKHRSYKGNNNSAGMYNKSQKYRIDMWNPKAANYRNPANYKNTDYDGGQPTVGSTQFGTKAQDTKQGLNTALGMDDASKAKTAAELDQRKAEMQTGAADFLQGNFDNSPKGFMGTDIDGNPQMIGTHAPEGAMAMDPNNPQVPQPGSDNMPDVYPGQNMDAMQQNSNVGGQQVNTDFLNQPFDQTTYTDVTPPGLMPAINTDGLNLGQGFAPTIDQIQQGIGQTTGSQPSPWDNLFDNLDGLTMDGMKKIAKDNDLPWENLASEAAKRGMDLGDIGGVGVDNIDSFGSKSFAGLQRAYNAKNQAQSSSTASNNNLQKRSGAAGDGNVGTGYQGFKASDGTTKREKTPEEIAAEEAELLRQQRQRNFNIGLGATANSAGDFYNLIHGMRGPEDIELARLNPNYVNLDEQRQIARENAGVSQAILRDNLRNAAQSSSGNLAGTVAGTAAIDQNLGNILRQSAVDEETMNTQIGNNANQFNTGIGNKEIELNMLADAKAQESIAAGLHGIGRNTAGALKDVRMSNQVDNLNDVQLNAINSILSNYEYDRNNKLRYKTPGIIG